MIFWAIFCLIMILELQHGGLVEAWASIGTILIIGGFYLYCWTRNED